MIGVWCVLLSVDHASQGMWAGLNLALSAANLADVSGDTLRRDAIAEVYVLAAMSIRFYFPSQLHFIAVSSLLTVSLVLALGLSLCLSVCLSVCVSVCLSVCLSWFVN